MHFVHACLFEPGALHACLFCTEVRAKVGTIGRLRRRPRSRRFSMMSKFRRVDLHGATKIARASMTRSWKRVSISFQP